MKRFPNALVIMIAFILFSGLMAFFLPSGVYLRAYDPALGVETVIPGSFTWVPGPDFTVFDILLSIPEGIISRSDIIVLILLIGGAFYVIERTGALKDGVLLLTHLLQGREGLGLWLVAFLFALGGALNGLQEEIIALVPVLLFFTRRLGFDPFILVAVSMGSAVVGSSMSPINPFAVAIAQDLAGLPYLSGSSFRMMGLLIGFLVWIIWLTRVSRKHRLITSEEEDMEFRMIPKRSALILAMTAGGFLLLVFGILRWGWGFNEMSAEFFVLGILAGLVGGLGLNGATSAYVDGFKEMIFAGVILGMASSISLILEKAMVIDTIIHGLFTPLKYLPNGMAASLMMVAQSLLHFPVPSYSGQAALTMPVLVPLSDLMGLSRQVCVLAFQYGAVMMDMIIPTNGALMAILALAGITWDKWARFILP
ncbi:MAG: YfcC family protein, partial [Bacteroidota bacterium]|nr:YfcC family protein [Bacteroidota bacterium]